MENVINPASLQPDAEEAVLERHRELYFGDGDIVLHAKLASSTGVRSFQLYCVHKAILSFHSSVFSNLFADGSAKLDQTYEGRPLVDMPDDAQDLSRLLLYVYNPSEYLLRSCHPDTPLELIGAVRLAGKYLLDDAHSAMIKRVTMDWPLTLDDWDVREGAYAVCDTLSESAAWVDRTPEPMSAIVFAQEHGCTKILPAAFYRLACIDIDDEWGVDGASRALRRARWSLCDKDNLVRWAKGRKALEARHRDVAQALTDGAMLGGEHCVPWWIFNPPDLMDPDDERFVPDATKNPCMHFFWTLRDVVWGTRLRTYNLLGELSKLDLDGGGYHTLAKFLKTCPQDLCYECRCGFDQWLSKERQKVWESLPAFFELE